MKKYHEHASGKINSDSEKSWYIHCIKHQVPYIVIKSRTKFADIHWDYITYSKENEKKLAAHANSINEFAEQLFFDYSKNSAKSTNYTVCGNLIWLKNLAISDARAAAERLYDFIERLL